MNGKLIGIGVGPGDPELMTFKALKAIKECDVQMCIRDSCNTGVCGDDKLKRGQYAGRYRNTGGYAAPGCKDGRMQD